MRPTSCARSNPCSRLRRSRIGRAARPNVSLQQTGDRWRLAALASVDLRPQLNSRVIHQPTSRFLRQGSVEFRAVLLNEMHRAIDAAATDALGMLESRGTEPVYPPGVALSAAELSA